MKDHRTELTTKKLVHLQNEQQNYLAEEQSSLEKEGIKDMPSSSIKQICAKWGDVQSFVEKTSDTVAADKAVNLFNDNVIFHFRKI